MLYSSLYILLAAIVIFLFWVVWRRLLVLRRHPHQSSHGQTTMPGERVAPRFVAQWPVSIGTRGGIRQGETRNVSQGGLFVQIDPPLELGQTYPMTIGVSGSQTIQVEGRVVWSISGGNKADAPAFGVGVMFTEISAQDLALVAALEQSFDMVAE